ncbi:MAG: thioredoxin [Muribaculaceae bacterium]|nr:thioredoxin [Muribaculaceae bacterium]
MDDFKKIIGENKPTIVDFFATWCGPCKVQGPILDDVKARVGDKANILKVDIDKNQALAMQYGVRSVPTLIIFKDGEAIWRGVGVHDAGTLVGKVEEYQYHKSDEA